MPPETYAVEPVTEPTQAWVMFDDDNIYIACRCSDARPGTIEYYESVRSSLAKYPDARTPGAPPTGDFYRLFLVPGMGHRGGGSGPNSFGNAGALTP